MYKDKSILGIIPARGGSKGLKRKNIRLLHGKPLIVWTIEAARKSKYIDAVIISTDDDEIAEISRDSGVEVPFKRPKRLATDKAKIIDVILHTLERMVKQHREYDYVMLLQPTSPLRNAEDIDNAVEFLFKKKAMAIVSVCKEEHPPYWSNTLQNNGSMARFLNKNVINKNRQELPQFYSLNGAIYMSDINYLKRRQSFYGNRTYAYIMPREKSVDVDSVIDLKLCEILIKEKLVQPNN